MVGCSTTTCNPIRFYDRIQDVGGPGLFLALSAMAAVHEHWSGREPIRHLPARASAGEALVFILSHRSRHEVVVFDRTGFDQFSLGGIDMW